MGLVFLPGLALMDGVKLRERIIKNSYVNKLSDPTLLLKKGAPLLRVVVCSPILVCPPAKPATFSPEKRSLFSIMCALFLPFSPRHGAIITAPLHSKRRSVLSVCAFRRGGALSAGPSPSRLRHFPR